MIHIHTLGGYDEVGRNMTAVEVQDEIIILDMGLYLEPYIKAQEQDYFHNPSAEELAATGALPDDSTLNKAKVVAIIPSHAHLDHLGAVPYMEKNYTAPILCTGFTKELLKILAREKHILIKNKMLVVNKSYTTKNTTIEFIPITHSTIETVLVAIHTKEGTILYANDFKIDMTPTYGQKPDMKKLTSFNTLALICDCIYAKQDQSTPSEARAKDMLADLFKTQNFDKQAIIISTFSSHVARLQTIVTCAKKINRKVLFLGRSLAKYVEAAENAGIIPFSEDVEIIPYKKQIKRRLEEIKNKKHKYVFVATGHQGEPRAILSKLATDQLPLKLEKGDVVIFSSTVIPVKENQKNSEMLEDALKKKQINIYKDIHVSGHAAGKDLKSFIQLIKPRHLFPAHGPDEMKQHLIKIGKQLNYSDEYLHCCHNGQTTAIN